MPINRNIENQPPIEQNIAVDNFTNIDVVLFPKRLLKREEPFGNKVSGMVKEIFREDPRLLNISVNGVRLSTNGEFTIPSIAENGILKFDYNVLGGFVEVPVENFPTTGIYLPPLEESSQE